MDEKSASLLPEDDKPGLDEPWRQRFALLRIASNEPSFKPRGRRRQLRAWYRLDPEESSSTGQLVLDLYEQSAEGETWGPLAPLALERTRPEHFSDPEDRDLVNFFRGTARTLAAQVRLSGRHRRLPESPWRFHRHRSPAPGDSDPYGLPTAGDSPGQAPARHRESSRAHGSPSRRVAASHRHRCTR